MPEGVAVHLNYLNLLKGLNQKVIGVVPHKDYEMTKKQSLRKNRYILREKGGELVGMKYTSLKKRGKSLEFKFESTNEKKPLFLLLSSLGAGATMRYIEDKDEVDRLVRRYHERLNLWIILEKGHIFLIDCHNTKNQVFKDVNLLN